MAVHEHKEEAPELVRCDVITVSDSRTLETDKSGKLMLSLLEEEGLKVLDRTIVPDEMEKIQRSVQQSLENEMVDVVLLNGGTGISERDVTIEAVQPLIHKEIPGFGELFRYLSYSEDIGSAALMSRALAGTKAGKAIFCTPGSSGAVRLAMTRLILPELRHIKRELWKDRHVDER
ncbi:MogA/MoaB family molybdenum cofactor biosynthesis protein [Salsuginibacillus kocurii]|uniref:MogA/MoaB family molybdenum cofactor biosynthesis protein n=1 Tax=Salsuginibacillus kocurii TaxID=427078 RepID=UPI00036FAC48|nr:molybdenum cofactor biosynthesis protein B [Salsuginibacillus kocurii]